MGNMRRRLEKKIGQDLMMLFVLLFFIQFSNQYEIIAIMLE
jgi:hypothetical protein